MAHRGQQGAGQRQSTQRSQGVQGGGGPQAAGHGHRQCQEQHLGAAVTQLRCHDSNKPVNNGRECRVACGV